MRYDKYSPDQVESRGAEIFAEQIQPVLPTDSVGKFVVIDIETAEYEIDDDDLQATKRALSRRAEAVLYGVRVGYPAAYSLGGHASAEDE
ncbi:MAG: hypothetical protein CMJ78_03820 [Planctomycetaceae bacterium]|nr:hypothetical protein [Planctomycetaceae bacterium]